MSSLTSLRQIVEVTVEFVTVEEDRGPPLLRDETVAANLIPQHPLRDTEVTGCFGEGIPALSGSVR